MRFVIFFLLGGFLLGCDTTVKKSEMESVDYGPRPQHFQASVRDYLKIRLRDPNAGGRQHLRGHGRRETETHHGPGELTAGDRAVLDPGDPSTQLALIHGSSLQPHRGAGPRARPSTGSTRSRWCE